MKINLASVFVDDQDKALGFYTETLGFVKKTEVPAGEFKWLTVVSPEDPDGVELLLEPSDHPAVKPFREAIVADGIPLYLVRGRQRAGRVRAAERARREIRAAADQHGPGHHSRLRRHVRQSDSNRRDELRRSPAGSWRLAFASPCGDVASGLLSGPGASITAWDQCLS